ncbi:hypothetical protein BDF19DRAFT_451087 [Syncephalis fuscata]|nr:hypothetical protein BDF19DRAFT_451087 [Syncephalis fuscata]
MKMNAQLDCRSEELPVAYYTDNTLRVLVPQLAQFELQPNALIGLNLFLDDLLFRLLKIVDKEGDGHDGSSRGVVQAFGYALSKILPAPAVTTICDRAAERTAFVMMSQPRAKRNKNSSSSLRSGSDRAGKQIVAALDRFPALRQHCALYLTGQGAESDWEVPLVVLAAECLRIMARVVMNATILVVQRSQRNAIDVNELLVALSTDPHLEPLINRMPSGVWMAEVVHVQVADSRPDAGMLDSWRQIIRHHRTLHTTKSDIGATDGYAQELRHFMHDPLAGLQQQQLQQNDSLREYTTPPSSIHSLMMNRSSSSLYDNNNNNNSKNIDDDTKSTRSLSSGKKKSSRRIWPFNSLIRR